jgi:hypothetical protein
MWTDECNTVGKSLPLQSSRSLMLVDPPASNFGGQNQRARSVSSVCASIIQVLYVTDVFLIVPGNG